MPKKKKKEEILPPLEEGTASFEEDQLFNDQQIVIVNNVENPNMQLEKYRNILICGDISEESSAQIMQSLFYYGSPVSMGVSEFTDLSGPPSPVTFNISTCGGSAIEMFGIYDVMRYVSEQVEIHTHGIGKVMSAGVLLLAAGTKGKRKIGRNCRVMIHGIMGGYHGNITNMENEIAEVKWIQKRYIENLVSETFLTKKKVRSMLQQQVDTYLSAEEAVKYGIADIVV